MNDFLNVLQDLGYSLFRAGNSYRTKALYRGGTNPNSLAIYENGAFHDFVTGEHGPVEKLVELTLRNGSNKAAEEWLSARKTTPTVHVRPEAKLSVPKFYPKELLSKLVAIDDYWNRRGISSKTLSVFRGGYCSTGKMKDRYVFPIFNEDDRIIGFSGRAVLPEMKIPWKHIGPKTEWAFPLYLNRETILESRRVFIVESIGDMLSLWEVGATNVLVSFGVEIGLGLLNGLIRLDPNKIILAYNNDISGVGQAAADKMTRKLLRYFDRRQICSRFPTEKDLNKMLVTDRDSLVQWVKSAV